MKRLALGGGILLEKMRLLYLSFETLSVLGCRLWITFSLHPARRHSMHNRSVSKIWTRFRNALHLLILPQLHVTHLNDQLDTISTFHRISPLTPRLLIVNHRVHWIILTSKCGIGFNFSFLLFLFPIYLGNITRMHAKRKNIIVAAICILEKRKWSVNQERK